MNHASSKLVVPPGKKVKLADIDPDDTHGMSKDRASPVLAKNLERLAVLQHMLYAEGRRALLVVLQGIDAGGKDGTIRHVMSGLNPQGVTVHSFKAPSAEELSHDFLWRCSRRLPARGAIAIFNRSHYEEVLVVRVHSELLEREQLPPKARRGKLWQRRYRAINDWERYLVENGFPVVKLFLNISREEQRRRFLKRIDRAEKNWKFSAGDVSERAWWDEYQEAFSEMLSHTSSRWAPWYVIPADHKWFARAAVGAVVVKRLVELEPRYPVLGAEEARELAEAHARLVAEAPKGAPPDPAQPD